MKPSSLIALGLLVAIVSGSVYALARGPVPGRDGIDDAQRALVEQYAGEAFPRWQARHPGRACPTIAELNYTADDIRSDD